MTEPRNDETTTSGVRFPPPLIYAAFMLTGWLLETLWPRPGFDDAWADPLAAVLIGAALLLIATAMGLFRAARTSPLPMRPTTALVLGGPYRFTRNPMYLAMALLYAGVALLFDLQWSLVLLPIVIALVQSLVIAREERYLEAKFGDEYRAYRGRVRRWL